MRSRIDCIIVLPVRNKQREQHGADDRVHDEADVADAVDLRAEEILLALRQRLVGRVREQRVDLRADRRGTIGIVDAQRVERDRAVAERALLVEVVVVDPEARSAGNAPSGMP